VAGSGGEGGGEIKMTKKKEDKLGQILQKQDEHDKKFVEHDDKFNRVIDKLLDHDKKFDGLKQEFNSRFDQVLTGLDKVISELEKARGDRLLAQDKDKKQDGHLDKIELVVGICNA